MRNPSLTSVRSISKLSAPPMLSEGMGVGAGVLGPLGLGIKGLLFIVFSSICCVYLFISM